MEKKDIEKLVIIHKLELLKEAESCSLLGSFWPTTPAEKMAERTRLMLEGTLPRVFVDKSQTIIAAQDLVNTSEISFSEFQHQ